MQVLNRTLLSKINNTSDHVLLYMFSPVFFHVPSMSRTLDLFRRGTPMWPRWALAQQNSLSLWERVGVREGT